MHDPLRPCPRRRPLIASLLAVAMLAGAVHAGPSGDWERISPPAPVGGAAAYSPTHRLMYVFGGDGTSIVHAVPGEGPPSEWENVAAVGTPPSPRAGAAMTYDNLNDRLLIFGGKDYSDVLQNDVWELSLSGTPTWSLVTTIGSAPAPCEFSSICFNEDRQILYVFGGIGAFGALNTNQMHKLDFFNAVPQWSTDAHLGDVPVARYAASMTFERRNDHLLLFGGHDASTDLADVTRYDLESETWTALAGTGDLPPATSRHFAGYDDDDDLLFVWGGSGGDGEVRTLSPFTQAWTIRPNMNWQAGPAGHTRPVGAWIQDAGRFIVLDGDGDCELFDFFYSIVNGSWWENVRQPGQPGDIHCAAAFVYDRNEDRAYLTGGCDYEYGNALQSTWSYDLSNQKGWYNTWFHNLSNNETPGLRQHVAVWDEKRDRMLVFGGMNQTFVRQNAVYSMNVTYGSYYDWLPVTPAGTPPTARFGTAAIYDPAGDRMLVFGGSDASGYPRGDLWQLALAPSPAWTRLVVPGGPSARQDHTAIYDSMHRRMIVFGGTDSLGGNSNNDAWALNLPAMTWTRLLPTGTPAPGRYQHTAVYDSRRGRMLVFGGQTVFGADPREVWELDLVPSTPVWRKLTPGVVQTGLPIHRYQHAAVYDSTGDRMLVFGGLLPPFGIFGNSYPLKDLWSLQFDGTGAVAGVETQPDGLAFALGVPAPNPSRGVTRLSYTLPRDGRVLAAIFDVAGRHVVTLEDGDLAAGRHELSWDGHNAGGGPALSGIFFCRVEAGGKSSTRKVLRLN